MVSRTDGDPPPLSLLSPLSPVCPSKKPPCVDSKTSPCVPAPRPACGNTCARGAGTHGDVLNLHTEVFFCVPSRATHNITHTTQHNTHNNNTTQHTTQHNTHNQHHNTTTTQHHTETDRETQRQKQRETEREQGSTTRRISHERKSSSKASDPTRSRAEL